MWGSTSIYKYYFLFPLTLYEKIIAFGTVYLKKGFYLKSVIIKPSLIKISEVILFTKRIHDMDFYDFLIL